MGWPAHLPSGEAHREREPAWMTAAKTHLGHAIIEQKKGELIADVTVVAVSGRDEGILASDVAGPV